jgi:hypothetical protein
MKSDFGFKYQLALMGWEALSQIFGWNYAYKKARGLSDLKMHIDLERLKMWQPYAGEKTLWQWVVKNNNGYCYLCSKPIHAWQKVEVDHDKALAKGGYSLPSNLHKTHQLCNRAKGTRTAEEYRRKL